MTDGTLVTVNIHVNDSTEFVAELLTDFVALRVGDDVDLFIMNSEQAKALMAAATDAMEILKEQEVGSTKPYQMLDAGKAWVGAIRADQIQYFNALLNWHLADWEVVMNRHGSFRPIQKDVDDFHTQFASSYLRGLK